MKDRGDANGEAGHDDSPRQDTQRPDHRDGADAGGHESTNDRLASTQARPAARPDGATAAPGERHRDDALPATGRQPQRPGQDGRYEPRPGARDPETLKPSDE